MYSITEFVTAYPNQLYLNISAEIRDKAWQVARDFSNKIASYNAYVNFICLQSCLQWFEEYFSEEPALKFTPFGTEKSQSINWEFVNGSVIQVGNSRLVLIPTDDVEIEEFSVPQEWVDIPHWRGDYYLAVGVNLEADAADCWLRVRGFTTHRRLKLEGKYDGDNRSYCLPVEALTENLNVLELTMGLCLQEEVPILPALSENETKSLLEILGNSGVFFPRLQTNIPFAKWGALLANDLAKNQLYNRRLGKFDAVAVGVKLSGWWENVFESGWQSLEEFMNLHSGQLSLAFRRKESPTREVAVEGIKLVDLGMEFGNQSVALLVGLMPAENDKIAVRVQLHPGSKQMYLTPNIKLSMVSESGKILQEVVARSQDNFIQLKRFTCPRGKSFKVEVSVRDFIIAENFVIE